MSDSSLKPRREFKNIGIGDILRYRLPLAGKVSILHRVSGVLLFLALPLVILPLFERTLISEIGFDSFKEIVTNPIVKLILLALIWGYLHHFCAGIRFLFLDKHVGLDKDSSRKSAAAVLVISVLLTLVFGLKLFGVF